MEKDFKIETFDYNGYIIETRKSYYDDTKYSGVIYDKAYYETDESYVYLNADFDGIRYNKRAEVIEYLTHYIDGVVTVFDNQLAKALYEENQLTRAIWNYLQNAIQESNRTRFDDIKLSEENYEREFLETVREVCENMLVNIEEPMI